MVIRYSRTCFALAAMVLGTLALGANQAAAQESSKPAATPDAIKIEPYTGPPIYLEETAQVAAPTIVARENVKENYRDGKTVRFERGIAKYSDDSYVADGSYLEFHPNGKPFVTGQYKEGKQVGEWVYTFDNGQVNRTVIYVDGKLDGKWDVFRADGTLAAKRGFKLGVRDGEWITYDATGKQPVTEEHYADGKQDGVWKIWFSNGKLQRQVSLKQGKRNGASSEWNDKGQPVIEANYAEDKLHGTVTRWLSDGKKVVQTYKNGRFESESKN